MRCLRRLGHDLQMQCGVGLQVCHGWLEGEAAVGARPDNADMYNTGT